MKQKRRGSKFRVECRRNHAEISHLRPHHEKNVVIKLYWILLYVDCGVKKSTLCIYYIFMDRKDPVGVCYSARNACSEKRPQIRHHRPCVEQGKAMRSKSTIFHDLDVLTFISFLFAPFTTTSVTCLSFSLILQNQPPQIPWWSPGNVQKSAKVIVFDKETLQNA